MPSLTPIAVRIDAGGVTLPGELALHPRGRGLVVFVHGSGSSRSSPRNQHVARALQACGYSTLLFDLLTADEERSEHRTRHLRFDIRLLANRVTETLRWLARRTDVRGVPIGLFGASTGAAAAFVAAASEPDIVTAVVSRGGRPDLAGDALDRVTAPSLLIVGGADPDVLALNRLALARLRAPRALHVVEHAGHLFEQPDAMDEVITFATRWFDNQLRSHATFAQHAVVAPPP